LDLFSGAGGFSLGLEKAGFASVGAVEKDEVAGRTYLGNFPEVPLRRFGPSQGDITRIDPWSVRDELIRLTGSAELDLIVAGPPCQGFSRIGRAKLNNLEGREKAFVDDPRNALYKRALHFVRVFKPKAVLIENVAGMLHHGGRNMAELAAMALESCGYVVRYTLVNSAWFGVPQSRERVFILGFATELGITPAFPARTHNLNLTSKQLTGATLDTERWSRPDLFVHPQLLPRKRELECTVSASEAIGDLPSFTLHLEAQAEGRAMKSGRGLHPEMPYRQGRPSAYASRMRRWIPRDSKLVEDHVCRWVPRDFETFRRMAPGDTYTRAHAIAWERYQEARRAAGKARRPEPDPDDFIPPYRVGDFEEKWKKLIAGQPSWTITAHLGKDTYSHIHYDSEQARAITPREAARLQSFPDGFTFEGSMGDMFKQIGNAVPPLLAFAFGRAIRKQLLAQAKQSSGRGREAQAG
jgi:DNA (cytosine-5)-methyltransferase 1